METEKEDNGKLVFSIEESEDGLYWWVVENETGYELAVGRVGYETEQGARDDIRWFIKRIKSKDYDIK